MVGLWIVSPSVLHHQDGAAFVAKGWFGSSWDLALAWLVPPGAVPRRADLAAPGRGAELGFGPIRSSMTPSPGQVVAVAPSAVGVSEALEEVVHFGATLMRAGDTAFRVREWMGTVASRLGLEQLSVHLALGTVSASARRGDERATVVLEIAPPGVNAWRIGALEALAREPDLRTKEVLAERLAEIEAAPPLYSIARTSAAIGLGCGSFAFLNGGGVLEMVTAGLAGGIGQGLRSKLLGRRFNQHAAAALSAVAAAGIYCLISIAALHLGLGIVRYAAGLVSSVLFLVPGFPLVAALLDLLQHQAAAALTRLAYAAMLLLAAAFGLFVVSALAGLDVTGPPSLELVAPVLLASRALASFFGACAFAILYNSSPRTVFAVGLLALAGNVLRLVLHDAGLIMASATFLGALAVGLLASLARRWIAEPRIALTVPGIIMMVPGFYSFQAIVLFARGELVPALQAAVQVGFVVGAMAMGLAAARYISQREWLGE